MCVTAASGFNFFRFIDENFWRVGHPCKQCGYRYFSPSGRATFEAWKETLETNLSGVFYCCKEGIPRLRQRGGGSIINISSLAGQEPFRRRRSLQCVQIRAEWIL